MLAERAWTRYTETQRQVGMDVPDYMPEGCPGFAVAYDYDKCGPGIAKDLNCMSFPHGQ